MHTYKALCNRPGVQIDNFVQIDTAANITVISPAAHMKIGSPPLQSADTGLNGSSCHNISVKGCFGTNLFEKNCIRKVKKMCF